MKSNLTLLASALCAFALTVPAQAQSCGSGSTGTHYLAGNSMNGVMFDITVGAQDMTIECVDVDIDVLGLVLDFEVYYCPTTSVGNEMNPAVWTQFGSVLGVVGNAVGVPDQIDISGNGQVFQAGQSYGIYITNSTALRIKYTNGGPTVYTGDHCDLTTNCGNTHLFGTTYYPREFNGELHTELAGPAGPSLSIASGSPGSFMSFDMANFTPNGQIALVYGPAGGYTTPGGGCAGLMIDLLPMNFPPLSSLILVGADNNGDAQYGRNVPGAASGLSLQAVDVGSCVASNAVVL